MAKTMKIKPRTVRMLVVLAAASLLSACAWFPSAKEPAYQMVTSWGGQGSGPGEFNEPIGIAVAGEKVFVSDARNGRIQVFDLNGNFKRQFGTPGEAEGQLGRPMNLAITENKLYVADYWNDRIAVFGLEGDWRYDLGRAGSGPGEFDAPSGVAVDQSGRLFIAEFYNHRVQLLSPDGRQLRQWGNTGQKGIWAGEFNYPTDVALAPDGTLYIADGYNDRVQVFSPSGEFSGKWGGPLAMNISGPFPGWFRTTMSVAIGPEDNVFVTDFLNHRIQKFTPEGTFLTAFGEQGHGSGQFERPLGVAVADNGDVFVVDFGNHRIQKWRPAR